MDRQILIVNDDGIAADGIRRLAEAALHFGQVYVVAPVQQCSGMSQKISIFDRIPVTPYAFSVPVAGAWSVGGTPADCVKVAVNFLISRKPDVVLSGINDGFNAGFDTAYSGTIGAAMEALMKGIPSISFSNHLHGNTETVDCFLPQLLGELLSSPLPPSELWNVNFPGVPLSDCRGILRHRRVAPVQLYRDIYSREEGPDGSFSLKNASRPIPLEEVPAGTDVHAVLSGYISIGTLHCPVL